MGAAMADLPPRYAYRVGPAERDLWADDDDDTSMPPRELETRRWMLVTATVGAGVLIVALLSVLVLGGGGSRPFQGDDRTTANVEQAGAPVATSEVSSSGTGASAAAATTNNADARQLAEARAGLAAMEAQLKSTTERADDLDRRLAAFEQTAAITTRRAEGAEAALVAEQGERARVQRDLDAMSGGPDAGERGPGGAPGAVTGRAGAGSEQPGAGGRPGRRGGAAAHLPRGAPGGAVLHDARQLGAARDGDAGRGRELRGRPRLVRSSRGAGEQPAQAGFAVPHHPRVVPGEERASHGGE